MEEASKLLDEKTAAEEKAKTASEEVSAVPHPHFYVLLRRMRGLADSKAEVGSCEFAVAAA